MMRFNVQNQYTFVSKASNEEYQILRDSLSIKAEGYWWSKKYRAGFWDGTYKFFSKGRFFTGLLDIVNEICFNNGIIPDIVLEHDPDTVRLSKESFFKIINQRRYQRVAVIKAIKRKRGVFSLATNAGKTLVMANVISILDLPTLVVVPSTDLVYQTAEVFSNYIEGVYTCYDERPDPTKVFISTPNSLQNYSDKFLESFKVRNLDECHRGSSDLWFKSMMRVRNFDYSFGWSGTPFYRSKVADWRLVGLTGRTLMRITNDDLIRMGYSSPIDVMFIKSSIQDSGEYRELKRKHIEESNWKGSMLQDIARLQRQVIVMVDTKRAAYHYSKFLPQYTVVTSDMSALNRKETYKAFKRKELSGMIMTPLGSEGLDLPDTSIIVRLGDDQVGSKAKNKRKVLQQIGRGLRKKSDDSSLLVIEFWDSGVEYLDDHSNNRIKLYRKEGFPIHILDVKDFLKFRRGDFFEFIENIEKESV